MIIQKKTDNNVTTADIDPKIDHRKSINKDKEMLIFTSSVH